MTRYSKPVSDSKTAPDSGTKPTRRFTSNVSRCKSSPQTVALGGAGLTLENLTTLYVGLARGGSVLPLRYQKESAPAWGGEGPPVVLHINVVSLSPQFRPAHVPHPHHRAVRVANLADPALEGEPRVGALAGAGEAAGLLDHGLPDFTVLGSMWL